MIRTIDGHGFTIEEIFNGIAVIYHLVGIPLPGNLPRLRVVVTGSPIFAIGSCHTRHVRSVRCRFIIAVDLHRVQLGDRRRTHIFPTVFLVIANPCREVHTLGIRGIHIGTDFHLERSQIVKRRFNTTGRVYGALAALARFRMNVIRGRLFTGCQTMTFRDDVQLAVLNLHAVCGVQQIDAFLKT